MFNLFNKKTTAEKLSEKRDRLAAKRCREAMPNILARLDTWSSLTDGYAFVEDEFIFIGTAFANGIAKELE